MSLFDIFFPDLSQASHLRRIADQGALNHTQQRLNRMRSDMSSATSSRKIESIQRDVDSMSLVIEALIESLDEKGLLSRGDLAEKAHEIDIRDGVLDGKITKEHPDTRPDSRPKLIIPD